jgi:hypothetical protein
LVVVATLIIAESSVSYLGLGIPPPSPSWGSMIADGQRELRTEPYLVLVPALVLLVTIYSLNFVGEYLSGALSQGRRRRRRRFSSGSAAQDDSVLIAEVPPPAAPSGARQALQDAGSGGVVTDPTSGRPSGRTDNTGVQ